MTAVTTPASDWDTVAAAWDARRDRAAAMKAELTSQLLAGLALRPGEHVLELGSGTGDLARRLAAAVGDSGRVLATDVSSAFVGVIQRTTTDLRNVEAQRVDAAATGLPDQTYDAVVFCMGLMHTLDPSAAMREMRRLLKPAGRVAATTWAAPEHNVWLPAIARSMVTTGMLEALSPREPGGVFSICDSDRLAALARSAGLRDVSVRAIDGVVRYPSLSDYIEQGTSFAPRLAARYASATAAQRATLLAAVEEAAKDFVEPGGALVFPTRALLLLAIR